MDLHSNKPRRLLAGALLAALCVSGAALATYYPPGCIVVKKFYDKNGNGVHNAGEPYLSGWPMTVNPGAITQNTGAGGSTTFNLAPGYYSVTEATPDQTNWVQSAPRVNGVPVNPVTGIHVKSGYTKTVKFGNYCKKPSGGRTPGFWSNQNGQAQMNDGGTMGPELALLVGLNLRNADGSDFDPVDYADFRAWLQARDATNMAYKLSAHLAAMRLNVEAGFVSGSAFYGPFGGTVNQLIAAADAALAADGLTPTGDPNRALQEQLKNYLDSLNNGALVIPSTPCRRTFTYTPY